MPTMTHDDLPRQVKLQKERDRIEKKRDLALIAERAKVTVQPWRVVCLSCDFVNLSAGGNAAGTEGDNHIRANRTHRVQLQSESIDGTWRKVIEYGWRPSLGFENEDIRR